MPPMKNQKGFTLVEIMIVVAIIGLIVAVAIPNILRSRSNANEGVIKSAMRTFSAANESYRAAQASPVYASAVTDLTTANPAYLDSTWTASTKLNFTLSYTSDGTSYSLIATPGFGLNNYYCVDQTGVIVSSTSAISPSSGCGSGTPIS